MRAFVNRHADVIKGVVSGLDRIVFIGRMFSIGVGQRLEGFLGAKGVRFKDFAALAQRCTKRVVAHAEQYAESQNRPFIYLPSCRESKEAVVDRVLAEQPTNKGLICVISCVESCRTLEIRRTPQGPRFKNVERRGRALYYYFLDREFGRIYVRIHSWWPFPVQVYLNGRSYLARQLEREDIAFVQDGNCLTDIADWPRAQALLSQLDRRRWHLTLDAFARRINPLLGDLLADQQDYYWCVEQSEHATDVAFDSAAALQALYPALLHHAMTHFGSQDVLRFFNRKLYWAFKSQITTDQRERTDGVRIKHRVKRNSVKMYDKAGSVLRIETTINDATDLRVVRESPRGLARLPMRKGICDLFHRAQLAHASNERYLGALAIVGERQPAHAELDQVNAPVTKRKRRHRPLHPTEGSDAALLQYLLQPSLRLGGFCNRDLTQLLYPDDCRHPETRRRASARTTRVLSLLRAHGIIRKLPRSRRYQLSRRGVRVATASINARQAPIATTFAAHAA